MNLKKYILNFFNKLVKTATIDPLFVEFKNKIKIVDEKITI